MRLSSALVVMRKDIDEFRKARYVMFTLILMPLIFAIIVPSVAVGPLYTNVTAETLSELGLQPIAGISASQQLFEFMISSLVFLFIVIPLATPSFIASYTVVGEKINRSLEPLLAAPITDAELLAGKILASVIPAVIATIISFVVFVAITNVALAAKLGIYFMPGPEWFIAVFILGPILAFLSTVIAVILSSRMNDIRAVQQVGAIVVLPLVGLFALSMTGTSFATPSVLLQISLVVLIIDFALFRLARRLFERELILTKWK
jgi:ABC-2 type transport system permease protein